MHRRTALKLLCVPLAFALFPLAAHPVLAAAAQPKAEALAGRISLYNINARETLDVAYLRPDGSFDTAALARLNHLFRCKMTQKERVIDPRLFLALDTLQQRVGATGARYTLICGYRSPEYNAKKCKRSGKSNSYHVKGMAADVRLDGMSLAELGKAAVALKAGGVGSYKDFIHLDVGPVRTW